MQFNQKIFYACGHFYNDLCACMWFSYLLVYFQYVIMMNNINAGYALMIGQVADGLSTIFVGIEFDKCFKKCKHWHLLGTFCVCIAFLLIFCPPLPFYINLFNINKINALSNNIYVETLKILPQYIKLLYYAPYIIIFQFGWACVQISHLSLIPKLTPVSSTRIEITSYRYAFTVLSYITIYMVSWYFLHNSISDDNFNSISPNDIYNFQDIVVVLTILGIFTTGVFQIFTMEDECSIPTETQPLIEHTDPPISNWTNWFFKTVFYQNCAIYVLTRVSSNVGMVYLPLFLLETLKLDRTAIALVPLVVCISGLILSLFIKRFTARLGYTHTYLLGALATVFSCLGFFLITTFATNQSIKKALVYLMAIFMGFGNSTLVILSLGLTADLIGNNLNTSSFVYGSMSLFDKVANGIVILLIQRFYPSRNLSLCGSYFKYVLCLVPSISTIFAQIILYFTPTTPIQN